MNRAIHCLGVRTPTETEQPNPQEYLTAILRGIVPRDEVLRITEESTGEVTVLTIHLPQQDRRFVVGKEARTICAVRDLMRAYSGRRGRHIVVKLYDEVYTTYEQHRTVPAST